MKKILMQTSSPVYQNNGLFGKDVNNMHDTWRELKRRLQLLGYELETADNHSLDDCAWIIFLDSTSVDGSESLGERLKSFLKKIAGGKKPSAKPRRKLYEEALRRGMADRVALFLWEGSVVIPRNYKPRVWKMFKYIFTWNDDLVDNKKFFKFYLPAPKWPAMPKPLPFREKKLLVNISANKWHHGNHELFGARVKTSKYFDSHYPDDFDLYGARWQMPITRRQKYFPSLIARFATYRGPTPDKMATLSKYKFALSYENVSDNKGYVTEKIFDIFQAGSVPIYWGAPNVEKYVDPAAFVDRRKFKNDEALAKYLKSVTEEEYEKMLRAGRAYLESDQCQKFFPEYFCDRIIEVLRLRSEKSL